MKFKALFPLVVALLILVAKGSLKEEAVCD